MTEIGFTEFSNSSSVGDRNDLCCDYFKGVECYSDSFWMDSLQLLESAFSKLEDAKPKSPASTRSDASLDSLLHTTSINTSISTPPESPWGGASFEEGFLPPISPTNTSVTKDPELEQAVNPLWPPSFSYGNPKHHCIWKSVSGGGSADLIQDFDGTDRATPVDGFEEQLASADTAWTATVKLPDIVADDVTHSISQDSNAVVQHSCVSPLRSCRKRPRKALALQSKGVSFPSCPRYVDPDSTDTGSEGEDSKITTLFQRKRNRMFIAGREELVEDLCGSEGDDQSDAINPNYYQVQTLKDTEPWWPLHPGPVQQRLGTGDVGGLSPGRTRRQLELWEFILRSLDSPPLRGKSSAFQWVDRAAGVFRVTDTHSAAKEWGLYRRNAKMDYEKMARAMRFYYKDSVLRKARKQLHFQFAMPFVEWSKRQHLLNKTSISDVSL